MRVFGESARGVSAVYVDIDSAPVPNRHRHPDDSDGAHATGPKEHHPAQKRLHSGTHGHTTCDHTTLSEGSLACPRARHCSTSGHALASTVETRVKI